MSEKDGGGVIAFITYTKGAVQYVTSPQYETQFLNWLDEHGGGLAGYARQTIARVGVKCSPTVVHSTEKREATILSLVKD